MKAVVTGGAGFIGSYIASELLKQGKNVTIIDNLVSGDKKNIAKKAEFVKADILEKEKIQNACSGAEEIWHFAADPRVKESVEKPERSFRINVIGTMNILEAARKNDTKKIVFANSSTIYGNAKTLPTPEESVQRPISPYGASKASCDAYLSAYAHSYGMDCASLVYANIYGPGSKHGVVYDFYQKLKKNPEKLTILGDGNQKKSYLYVTDCVSASTLAAEKTRGYKIYNIGSEEWHTVDYIAKQVCTAMKLNPSFNYTGGKTGWTGDVPRFILDITKIKNLGWKPKISLEQGIRKYIEWLSYASKF